MVLKAVSVARDGWFQIGVLRGWRTARRPHPTNRYRWIVLVALGAITVMSGSPSRTAAAPVVIVQATATPENAFTARDAGRLLDQIASGLVEHDRKKILGAFDLGRMTDSQIFEQQITSFLAHSGIIRVHYNGIDAGMEEGKGVTSVDFEMDADQRDDNLPPVRKQAHLQLIAEKTPAGWKLTDVQPRSFFSLSQP
jgi:hypothetical protein